MVWDGEESTKQMIFAASAERAKNLTEEEIVESLVDISVLLLNDYRPPTRDGVIALATDLNEGRPINEALVDKYLAAYVMDGDRYTLDRKE